MAFFLLLPRPDEAHPRDELQASQTGGTHARPKPSPPESNAHEAATMAEREREVDEGNEALDPELLYSKEYCIG